MEGTLAARLPKAVLHDHLDGGLRINTLLELAAEHGYHALPATTPDELTVAMDQKDSGSLVAYLASFAHTVGVMQTAPAIERVAYEATVDHHLAGVVYAELRFGPALLTEQGLTLEQAIEAALSGLQRATSETGIDVSLIISALRNDPGSVRVAEAAVSFAGQGVVGFDLAGPEDGYPPSEHIAAIDIAREGGLSITLHAGEGAGLVSIEDALNSGAERIGHGVRIIEDCAVTNGTIVDLGPLARKIHEAQVPLEVAISSNLHTGIAEEASQHPFGTLYGAGFNVSINTDNRLMSNIDMAEEFKLAADTFGLTIGDLASITARTIEAGFGDVQRRADASSLAADGYAAAIAES